jgi:segregation and condensation protein B
MTDRAELEAAIEALLFVASEPIQRPKLLEVFSKRDRAAAEEALEAVLARYREAPDRGVFAEQVAGGLRLVTRPDLSDYLRKMFEVTGRNRLSMAALETLAIVAYRQPVTAPEVQELRGVNSKGVLSTLLEHRLVRLAGRKEVVGQPFMYRTTKEFLAHFGLDSVDDLPPLEEFEEMLGVELGTADGAFEAVSGASSEEE